jgi:hypothetical protein
MGVCCFPHSKYLISSGVREPREPRGSGNNLSCIQRDTSFVSRLLSGSSFLLKHTDSHILTSWSAAYRIEKDKVAEVKDYLDIREIK